MEKHRLNRSLTVTADGEPLSFSGRMRLRGKDDLSLFPALFTLELWNLPEELFLRLSRCREIAVSHGGACLVSGRVWDVYRRGTEEGILTSVSVSIGLDLWESVVSLAVPAGTLLSDAVRQILAASGTGIPLLTFPEQGDGSARSTDVDLQNRNPAKAPPEPLPRRSAVLHRTLSLFGRASECIASALSAASCRAMLTPSGLMVVPPGGLPDAVNISETDLMDAPAFAGGSLHGSPSLMILSAAVSGWRPGQTAEADYKDVHARGIITERSVDADTAAGPWKCEMIVEVT